MTKSKSAMKIKPQEMWAAISKRGLIRRVSVSQHMLVIFQDETLARVLVTKLPNRKKHNVK